MSGLPVSHDEARTAARHVLELEGADGVEVVVTGASTGLTRYAGSQVIQNTARDEVRAYVRVALGDRVATATTNQLDPEQMTRAAGRALEGARASVPDAQFPGLAGPAKVGRPKASGGWDDSTADATPAQRADAVERIFGLVGPHSAAGIYETSAHAFAVVSSTGVDCFDAYTRCVVSCLVDSGEATGWGEQSSHAIADVDVETAARRALAKVTDVAGAGEARLPGTYEVVLEPAAVATLVEYLSWMGFGAKQVLEGESFLAEQAGKSVAAPDVTIADDVWHPTSVGIGFDFEGVPRRRVAVIDAGTATGPVTDLRTARILDTDLTGHSSGSDEVGPFASNVVMSPGDESLEDLIADVDSGFLVTRFHYVNILDRPATLLTGMTRDGTFRIRRGEVVGAVRNFRFTQSVLDALGSVTGIGRDLATFAPEYGSFGSTAVPALRMGAFHFASATSH